MSESDRVQVKKKEVMKILESIVKEKKKNKKMFIKYRKRHNVLRVGTHCCNGISVSSLITSVATVNPITVIVGLIFGSCSSIGSSLNDSMDNLNKFLVTRTTYNQLSDLEREIRSVLLKNHLTSDDLSNLIDDTNHRISLIQDSSLF